MAIQFNIVFSPSFDLFSTILSQFCLSLITVFPRFHQNLDSSLSLWFIFIPFSRLFYPNFLNFISIYLFLFHQFFIQYCNIFRFFYFISISRFPWFFFQILCQFCFCFFSAFFLIFLCSISVSSRFSSFYLIYSNSNFISDFSKIVVHFVFSAIFCLVLIFTFFIFVIHCLNFFSNLWSNLPLFKIYINFVPFL